MYQASVALVDFVNLYIYRASTLISSGPLGAKMTRKIPLQPTVQSNAEQCRARRAIPWRPMPESRGRVELLPDHSPLELRATRFQRRAFRAFSECNESEDSQPLSVLAPDWASGRFVTPACFTIFCGQGSIGDAHCPPLTISCTTYDVAAERGPKRANFQFARIATS